MTKKICCTRKHPNLVSTLVAQYQMRHTRKMCWPLDLGTFRLKKQSGARKRYESQSQGSTCQATDLTISRERQTEIHRLDDIYKQQRLEDVPHIKRGCLPPICVWCSLRRQKVTIVCRMMRKSSELKQSAAANKLGEKQVDRQTHPE